MIADISALIAEYHTWLRDRTMLRQVGDSVAITTPYLDRHNDCVTIYASRHDGGYVLSDDGFTIDDLELSGCKLDSDKRHALLRGALNGFGIQLVDGRLEVPATPDSFAAAKHNLVQAMLAVGDLFYLAAPIVASLFFEDVVAWLDLSEIRYTPHVKFTGKSGFDHHFDFVIPKSRQQPERILRTVTHPSRDTAQALVFAWMDTRDVRTHDSRVYGVLNDGERPVPSPVLDALARYDVRPMLWSRRDATHAELAA